MTLARSALVWGVRHGVPGFAIRMAARRGDLVARLTVDAALREDPYPAYDELRARGEIVRGPLIHASAGHAVSTAVLRDQRFRAGPTPSATSRLGRLVARAVDPMAIGPDEPPSLLALDPPQHTRIRKLVTRAFSAKAVAALEPRVRELADGLLDRVADRSEFDLVESYAGELPVLLIAEILGVPAAERAEFRSWIDEVVRTLDPGLTWRDFRTAQRALTRAHTWFDRHIAALRRDPGDDLLSTLVQVSDGDRLNDEGLSDTELRVTALLLLGAGFETTVNLVGNAVRALLAHPEQLAALRADPTLWGGAVDEALRYDSPVQFTFRTAASDIEIAGRQVRAGESILLALGGANRDPAVFADPHRFDITRANAREHLAFSTGVHFCLGAQLAKLEGAVALEALFSRFPALAPAGEPTRRSTRVLRGYARLPVRTLPVASPRSSRT